MNKINWKVRFKNPTWLITAITATVAFVYQILSILDIVPGVSETEIINVITTVINFLAMVGIVVDPTTKGIIDSERAQSYDSPN